MTNSEFRDTKHAKVASHFRFSGVYSFVDNDER